MICYFCGNETNDKICPVCKKDQGNMQGGDGYFNIVKEIGLTGQGTKNVTQRSENRMRSAGAGYDNNQTGRATSTIDYKPEIDRLKNITNTNLVEIRRIDNEYHNDHATIAWMKIIVIAAALLCCALITTNIISFAKISDCNEEIAILQEKLGALETDESQMKSEFEDAKSQMAQSDSSADENDGEVIDRLDEMDRKYEELTVSVNGLYKAITEEEKNSEGESRDDLAD